MALLGNLTGSSQFFNPPTFYKDAISTSYRNDNASDAHLYVNKGGNGDRQTFTISWWMKIGTSLTGTIYTSGYSGSGGSASSGHIITSSNKVRMQNQVNNSAEWTLDSTRLFRDASAWYNCVLAVDTTQGTEANRIKLYVNGVQETLSGSYPSQNANLRMNNQYEKIGTWDDGGNRYFEFDGYFADFNLIDGTQLDASSFGEFKNGVWIPVDTSSLTRGTKGWRLQFKQVGVGTASSSTVGADTGGNDFHFTSSGIVASDCAMPDGPENNFCTMNSIDNYNTGVSYSEGNLRWTIGGNDGAGRSTFIMTSGKWYVEFYRKTNIDYIGVVSGNADIITVNGTQTVFYAGDGTKRVNGSSSSYGASYANGDIIGIALNMDDEEVTFYKNNASQGTISLTSVGNEGYGVSPASGTGSTVATANFGQDSSFAGDVTAQGNTDGNGIGDFYYAPPSGFLAMCTANLPEPTIGPNSATQSDDNFDTLLYTGNNEVAQDIGGLEFQPDWVWIKGRSYTDHHAIFDSSRGVGRILYSNGNYTDDSAVNTLDEFRSDGFGVGTDAGAGLVNTDSNTYVAWNWKANGGTATATASEVDNANPAYSQQANSTSGFSIVTWTGTGADATIPHGLSEAPELIITKSRSDADHWYTYSKYAATSNPEQYELYLNLTLASYRDGSDNTRAWNATAPTSSVFSIGTADGVNEDGDTFVAYCFHSVEGYSKIGSFSGNNNVDGPFVYTGFRPAFFILRDTANAGSWVIYDSVRDTINPAYKKLDARSNGAESTNSGLGRIDFLSNGFKIRDNNSNSHMNQATSSVFLYIAFAEAPFKYANAR